MTDVFLLYKHHGYEGDELLAVYATPERAVEERDLLNGDERPEPSHYEFGDQSLLRVLVRRVPLHE